MIREPTDKEIAVALGKSISGGKPMMCPMCSYEMHSHGGQTMESYGDFEDTLFCPHCDMDVQLTIVSVPNRGVMEFKE